PPRPPPPSRPGPAGRCPRCRPPPRPAGRSRTPAPPRPPRTRHPGRGTRHLARACGCHRGARLERYRAPRTSTVASPNRGSPGWIPPAGPATMNSMTEPHPSAAAFRAARDLLLHHRDDYTAAKREFSWPALEEFNWALDWFDVAAAGHPDQTALR